MQHAKEGREMHTKLWSQNLKERDHLEDTHSDERRILKSMYKIMGWECVSWMHLAPWRACVNIHWVPPNTCEFVLYCIL